MSKIDIIISKYIDEAENFTSFQQKILYDYTNQESKNIRSTKDVVNANAYMWRLGGLNKESDSTLQSQIEELIKKGYVQIKNGTFSLTDKGKKTDISKNASKQVGSNYGRGSGSWTGD